MKIFKHFILVSMVVTLMVAASSSASAHPRHGLRGGFFFDGYPNYYDNAFYRHLGDLDIIEEGHVEALALALVAGLVLVFSLIEVVEVGVGIIDTTGIAEIDISKGVMIK